MPAGALSLEHGAPRSLLNLRGPAAETGFADAVCEVLGCRLPAAPNRWNGTRERAALWLGPDEWLLIAPDGEAARLEAALRAARPEDPWMSVVDVSHNYAALLVAGTGAAEVLARGCRLDLHRSTFGPGDCAQTLLAKAPVILRCLNASASFEILVRNSYARYLAEWLQDAMAFMS